jgi:hypothetical protein
LGTSLIKKNKKSDDSQMTGPSLKSYKRRIAKALNLLIVFSVVAFAVYLYKNELLYIPSPRRFDALAASVVMFLVGQVLGTLSWWRVLKLDFDNIPPSATLAGTALSNLGKYVPGKFWVVAGRAAYVANKTDESLVRLTTSSTRSQLITVWMGITIGVLGVIFTDVPMESFPILLGIWIILLLVIVSGVLEWSGSRFHRVFRPDSLPVRQMSVYNLITVLPFFVPGPLFRMLGFWLLAVSLVDGVSWQIMFAFPLATALGMAAVFAPGGIGVREAILVGAMLGLGMSLPDATTVAVAARVWAATGDIALFVIGLLTDRVISARSTE